MRTKTLVMTAAAMVAGVLASSAQVYSANVVGYVTKSYANGSLYMIANPLQNTNNTLATLFPNPPSGTAIYVYDAVAMDFTANYTFQGTAWDVPTATIPPGMGVFLYAAGDFTNTYVGDVLQGSLTNNYIAGNGLLSAVGSMVPIGGSVSNVMAGYVGQDGDAVYTWDPTIQDIANNSGLQGGVWTPDVTLQVGEAFFFFRQGPTAPWIRQFTVQ